MLSDDSDLTELSYEENAVQATKAKESKKKMGYRLRNVLKPGRTTQYTAKALYDQIHDNDINLDPEYQRDVVWSEAKQIGLIDSIFRNFYVPPIIFAVTTEDDGTEKRVCIDGKQRLTSIQKFIGGLIPHRDAFTNEKLWFIDSTTGPKRRLLPPQYKTLFQNKQIVCIEYSELPPDLEREVFQRVQMGMALTTAEKMQAISGPWPDLVREITNEYHLGVDGISENMDLNHARARDFQNLAQLIYCVDQLPGQVQGTTMQVEKWLSREDGPSEGFRKRIHDVFKTFRDIARDKQLKAPLKKPSRVAPAEFIMIGILIAMFKDRFSLPQLSQAIGTLRTETRAVHADVRANAKVFKTMFQLLSKQIPDSPQVETSGRPIAGSSSGTPTVRNNSGLGKRKRHESSEDDDDISPKLQDSHDPPQHRVPKSPSARLSLAINGPSKAKAEDNKSPVTRPGRFARIQAAKAQAAITVNTTGSGISSTNTPQSLPPRESPFPTLHTQHQASQNTPSLEATMMGTASKQKYHSPHPTSPLNIPPTHPRDMAMQHTPIRTPIPTNNNAGAYHLDSQTLNGQWQGGSARSSRDERSDDGGYRERHGYDGQGRQHHEDKGSHRDREVDHGRDSSRNSYSSRDPYPKPRDADVERMPGRDGRELNHEDKGSHRDREVDYGRDSSRSSYSSRDPYPKVRDADAERMPGRDGREFVRGSGYHGR